jgi:hypothetical protein
MKIFHDLSYDLARSHCWFYHYEPGWTAVYSVAEADVIPLIPDISSNYDPAWLRSVVQPHHIILILNVTHAAEDFDSNYVQHVAMELEGVTDRFLIAHTNANSLVMGSDPRLVYWDCLFDRSRLYFTDYRCIRDLPPQVWTMNTHAGTFTLSDDRRRISRKFLAPMRVYPTGEPINRRMRLRQRLRDHLEDRGGLISRPEQSVTFLPQGCDSLAFGGILNNTAGVGGVWEPMANCYYDVTAASIYVETIVSGHQMHTITEKTWDPLIKRHFILPFGYPGMIRDLVQDYGVLLPDFIDYSYDTIPDFEERFSAYLTSVDQFLALSLEELQTLVFNHSELLEHNRSIFFNRGYHSLYNKVQQACQQLGWL